MIDKNTEYSEDVLRNLDCHRDTIVILSQNEQAGVIEVIHEENAIRAIVCLFPSDGNNSSRIIGTAIIDGCTNREEAIYTALNSIGDRLMDECGIYLSESLKPRFWKWRDAFKNTGYSVIDVEYYK